MSDQDDNNIQAGADEPKRRGRPPKADQPEVEAPPAPEPTTMWVQSITDQGPWLGNRKLKRGEKIEVDIATAKVVIKNGHCVRVSA